MESFTWESVPNNVDSALIPAAFPRILGQIDAVSPFVEAVITFCVEVSACVHEYMSMCAGE